MDRGMFSNKSVLATLLKTNRPPTDEEKAILQESMVPTNAKLKVVQSDISDTMAQIQALKSQVEQAEIKLQRLHAEEAAILETFADHRRAFSPFRNLPEDVLREICVACVEVDMPTLSFGITPLPYRLAQISSGMRYVALTTPFIWSFMNVAIDPKIGYYQKLGQLEYSILARKAGEWFGRSGQLALTVFIEDPTSSTAYPLAINSQSDPSNILFDTLLSYSARWKEMQYDLSPNASVESAPLTRISKLTAVDAPLLESVSLRLGGSASGPVFCNSPLLTIPTLRRITLAANYVHDFTVNWAVLTSVTLRGDLYYPFNPRSAIVRIFEQTKCLEFCDIDVGPDRSEEHYADKVHLPFMKTLLINETSFHDLNGSPATSSLLDIITAPNLAIFHVRGTFLDLSLANFFKQSLHIQKLSLPYSNKAQSLTYTMGLLRHCPSLTALSLQPSQWDMDTPPSKRDANGFLRAFVGQDDTGVTCPRLQYFNLMGNIQFSFETLRLFLECKQGEFARLNALLAWTRVDIDIKGITDKEICQQILDLVSQKKAAGLDVNAFIKKESPRKGHHLY